MTHTISKLVKIYGVPIFLGLFYLAIARMTYVVAHEEFIEKCNRMVAHNVYPTMSHCSRLEFPDYFVGAALWPVYWPIRGTFYIADRALEDIRNEQP